MDKRYLVETSLIYKDSLVWNAFLAVLAHEEGKIVDKLQGPKEIDELIRINAEYTLIQRLKKLRETAIYAEQHSPDRPQ